MRASRAGRGGGRGAAGRAPRRDDGGRGGRQRAVAAVARQRAVDARVQDGGLERRGGARARAGARDGAVVGASGRVCAAGGRRRTRCSTACCTWTAAGRRLGLFDCRRVGGVDLGSESALARHTRGRAVPGRAGVG